MLQVESEPTAALDYSNDLQINRILFIFPSPSYYLL